MLLEMSDQSLLIFTGMLFGAFLDLLFSICNFFLQKALLIRKQRKSDIVQGGSSDDNQSTPEG